MERIRKGLSFLLALMICISAGLIYVGRAAASDMETNGQTVRIKQTEHGKVRFADFDGTMNLFQKGDVVTLEAEPEDGYSLGKLQMLDALTEEDLQIEIKEDDRLGEQYRFSFIMGEKSVVVHTEFEEIHKNTQEEAFTETPKEKPEETPDREYGFGAEGYIWGKDSEKTDTERSARVGEQTAGRMRRLASGSDVVIKAGAVHNYGEWGTSEFSVTTNSGQFLGYCAQPTLSPPNGTYQVSVLNNDLIKAALMIAPGGDPQMYEEYGKSIYMEEKNNVYAFAHALIGFLYMGSLKGLGPFMAANIRSMEEKLNRLMQEPGYEEFQNRLRQCTAYIVYTGDDKYQDIVWLERNPAGYARLKKTSANTGITDGNSCYSLAGAQYGVFRDSGCTQQAAVLTTDTAGNSDTATLNEGTYYVKEIRAAKGYALDSQVYPIQVTTGQTAELKVSDEPVLAPALLIYKVDRETKGAKALGAASLENTRFRVNFYSGHYTKGNLPAKATRSWVIKAAALEGSKGARRSAVEERPDKVSGDAFYQVGEEVILPLGTLSVEEIQAPAGYQLDSSYLSITGNSGEKERVHVAQIIQSGNQGIVEDGPRYTVADSVIRADMELTKIDKNTQRPIAGVPFRITSKTTKESHVIMTDENGHYSSSSAYAAHSYRTNGGQAGDGLWFGLDADGRNVLVDDGVGALPYDTYTIEELKCAANEGKFLYSGSFTITRANYIVNLGNVENADVAIETTAKDEATGTHYASAGDVTLLDTVRYIGLQKEKTYRLTGSLMNRTTGRRVTDEDGEPVVVTKTFTPKDSNGEVEVEFTFDAFGLKGNDVVVYEELYLGNEKLAEHADINDESQTIHFPEIRTRAVDYETNGGAAKADEDMVIVDTVSYENLRAGRKYKITGILMDKDTKRAVLDDNGSKVEAETTFTAKRASGTVEVVFRFGGRKLAGKTLVAFETLEKDNKEYAVHHDIEDEAQTVYIPKISTKVYDSDTKSQVSRADEEVTLIDEVKYENLLAGREYLLRGTLVNPETKKAAVDAGGNPITGQTVFVPSKKNGSAEVTFRFDGSSLAGDTYVIFEELLCGGKLLAEHKDAKDEGQTVYFPSLETRASDRETGRGIAYANERVVIEDVVHYENLIPGKKYTVQGVLKDQSTKESLKDAKGKEVTAKKEFTAKDAKGDVTVVFEFDGSILAGKTTVAFEELFMEKKSIAIHADIHDEAQTVEFPKIRTQAADQKSGMNLTMASDEIRVVDRVSYQHLIPGCGYRLEGILMDQKTGEPAVDSKGKRIQADTKFTAKDKDGTVELTFQFSGNGLAGRTFVVFEELSMEKSWFQDVTVAVHRDMEDEAQTIYLPKIGTAVRDKATGMRMARADSEVILIDDVEYENLLAGREYVLKGTLMDAETKKEAAGRNGKPITAQTVFTPDKKDGSVQVEFRFDGKELAGRTVVVYEELLCQEHKVAEHKDLKDEKQTVHFPSIATTAKDTKTGERISFAGEQVTIEDVVHYENLIPGKKYTIAGMLMEKSTGKPLTDAKGKEIRAEKEFTAEEAKGDETVVFTFDGSVLAGKVTVAFEELFTEKKSLAVHMDIEDEPQTVKFPRIQTQAADKETKTNMTMASEKVTIVDTVSYWNLIPEHQYHLKGTLMDLETKEPALDADGNEIRADMTFVPKEAQGTVKLSFCFAGKGLEGHTFVVFEELSMEQSWFQETVVAIHKDMEDEAQTIHFPKVWTTALDDETLSHQAKADEKIGVTDMVYYSNVLVGNEYRVKGVLMDYETGEVLKDDKGEAVTAEASFTAEGTKGEIPVEFSLSGASLAGKTAVLYERLEYEDVLVASHEDLEETKQSIYFPSIKTSARDKENDDKELVIKDMVTLTDEVEYQNLIPDTEYRMEGRVMDKNTGEALVIADLPVKAERVFKPKKPSGSIDVEFTFQSKGMEEKELVVFEKLYMTDNGEEVVSHEDWEDENQTVRLVREPSPPRRVKTGDGSEREIPVYVVLAAISAAALLSIGGKRRRKL